jgi:hypothetical protein
VVPTSPILVTLMMAALSSSDTSVLTIATLSNITEDGILHSDRSENLKSYKNLAVQLHMIAVKSYRIVTEFIFRPCSPWIRIYVTHREGNDLSAPL